jgi:signal transduction histidine kinase
VNLRRTRLRLTAAYGLVALVVVSGFAMWAVAAETAAIRDRARAEAAGTVTEALVASDRATLDLANTWQVNPDPDGQWSTPFGETWVEPPLTTVAQQALDADATAEARFVQDETDFLVLGTPLEDGTAIVTALDLTDAQSQIGWARWKAVNFVLIAVALATGLSWWLVGRSLRPAREVLDHQRDFVADAAHEMRTPLAVIQASASQALHRDREPGEYRQVLEEIRGAATRAAAGVGELLELARLDAGQAQPRVAPLRLDLLAEEVASSVIVDGVHVRAETPPRPVVVPADYLLLRQAVENLVRNAAARSTSVVVRVVSDGERAAVRVEDDGPGFDPETLPSVFERFRRGDTKGGAGLGLAIARSIVELHHGTIAAENRPEGGAAVVVELPLER